jgi:hypothetical protein
MVKEYVGEDAGLGSEGYTTAPSWRLSDRERWRAELFEPTALVTRTNDEPPRAGDGSGHTPPWVCGVR